LRAASSLFDTSTLSFPAQLWIQFVSVVVTLILAFVGTYILLFIVKAIMGLRIADDEERMGLDLSQHNERAYE